MKVLVTGATGTLGRAVVPHLAKEGHVVEEAVEGVDAVVHLASATRQVRGRAQVDVAGTRLLADAAARAGVKHLLYVSIVGIDRVPLGYYRLKLAAEEVVQAAAMPWSILRATQFPQLLDGLLRGASRLGAVIGDRRLLVQPVDPRDVAERLSRRLAEGPGQGTEEYGGPQVLRFDEAARAWLAAQHRRQPIVSIPIPGRFARAVRAGGLTTTATPTGVRTWHGYLTETYG